MSSGLSVANCCNPAHRLLGRSQEPFSLVIVYFFPALAIGDTAIAPPRSDPVARPMTLSRTQGIWIAAAAAVLLVAGGYAILRGMPGSRAADAKGPQSIPVTTAAVVARTMPVKLYAIGNVEPYTTVAVQARVDGQLVGVRFKEGDEVKKGAVLFEIDARPFEASLRRRRPICCATRRCSTAPSSRKSATRICSTRSSSRPTPTSRYARTRRPPARRCAPTRPRSRTRSCSSSTARSARRSPATPARS